MSKAIYRLAEGLAFVITTGEPVFITSITTNENNTEVATVIRAVVTSDGIQHREEEFPTNQLESPEAQVKRRLEFDDFVRSLQEKYQAKHLNLSAVQRQTLKQLQAKNPSESKPLMFNGDGDVNG